MIGLSPGWDQWIIYGFKSPEKATGSGARKRRVPGSDVTNAWIGLDSNLLDGLNMTSEAVAKAPSRPSQSEVAAR